MFSAIFIIENRSTFLFFYKTTKFSKKKKKSEDLSQFLSKSKKTTKRNVRKPIG